MGDIEKGKKIFVQSCALVPYCGKGRQAQDWAKSPWFIWLKGQASGFSYTDANKNKGNAWGEATLKGYLENPGSTSMELK